MSGGTISWSEGEPQSTPATRAVLAVGALNGVRICGLHQCEVVVAHGCVEFYVPGGHGIALVSSGQRALLRNKPGVRDIKMLFGWPCFEAQLALGLKVAGYRVERHSVSQFDLAIDDFREMSTGTLRARRDLAVAAFLRMQAALVVAIFVDGIGLALVASLALTWLWAGAVAATPGMLCLVVFALMRIILGLSAVVFRTPPPDVVASLCGKSGGDDK